MKKLIVNGDDFGLSAGTNRAIEDAHRYGILTSATLLTNMPGFDDAVIRAKRNPGLGIGIHLNLTIGKPLSPDSKVGQLVDSKGKFKTPEWKFFVRHYFTNAGIEQIKVEIEAQIKKFLDSGLKPSHVDTHHHIILIPKVYDIVIDLMDKYKIGKFRFYHAQRTYFSDKNKLRKYPKKWLVYRNQGKSKSSKYQMPDYIFDLEDVSLSKRLHQIREGINEIISHPAYSDKENKKMPVLGARREEEVKEITDSSVLNIIKTEEITLTNYEKF